MYRQDVAKVVQAFSHNDELFLPTEFRVLTPFHPKVKTAQAAQRSTVCAVTENPESSGTPRNAGVKRNDFQISASF